jgi:hypothetical protein
VSGYVARYPEEESPIERVIEFRRRVGEEFDRLVRASEPLALEVSRSQIGGATVIWKTPCSDIK